MKTKNVISAIAGITLVALLFSGCKKDEKDSEDCYEPGTDVQAKLQEELINMEDGTTICLGAGTFDFTSTLSVEGKNNITIKGAGKDVTILSFAGQTAGAEGVLVTNVKWFLIKDLTIRDTDGDAIKIKDSDGVSMINVATEWSGDSKETNGSYGLYPVKCTNVLIDNCYVKGASDAGIYVGQSEKAIVRNSTAEMNVAGIEIENTTSAEVYNNTSTHNTGGILVFDLPNLSVYGSKTIVRNNTILQNDHENFAPAGNIVANVPAGTGIMVMSTKQVEVYDNTITNNNVMGMGVVSYLVLASFDSSLAITDPMYDPYPSGINVHNNTFSRTTTYPSSNNLIGLLLQAMYSAGDIPDILFDGIYNSQSQPSDVLCIRNNGSATFVNLDAEHNFQNKSTDISVHDCAPAPLPAVTVSAPGI